MCHISLQSPQKCLLLDIGAVMGSERVVPEPDRCPTRHFGPSGRSRQEEA